MTSKIDTIRDRIFGDRDSITSERYFLTITTFTVSIFSICFSVYHLISTPSITPFIIAVCSSALIFGLYYFARFHGALIIPKTILTLGGLIILDLLYYSRHLSSGPVLLFILIFVAFVLWLWEGKQLLYMLLLYFLNLGILFYIDYNASYLLLVYPNQEAKSIDMFLSFLFYSALLIFFLYVFKQEFLRQKKKAIDSDKLKSAFLANMSHEIRTPMNGILGFSDLLKNPNLTGEMQQQYHGIIEKSGRRMLNVINDIMDVSKIEAGLINVEIQESNIDKQLEYIYKFFKPEVEAKGMILDYKNSKNVEHTIIKTDPEKVFAIFTNLVKNAIKCSKTGTIEFGYAIAGDFIEFYVKDTGIGIAKDRQQAIFERFIQADIEDVQARQGAGLGLSITKSYVELLGGKIWVESEVGIGSKFNFTLPYYRIIKKKIVTTKELFLDGTALNDLTLNILIVEDDEISETLISIIVSEFCKVPLKAQTGDEAVQICSDNPDIDLILMDIQLPRMNGYEVTRKIREFNKDVIIIAQTAFGLSRDKENSIEAGCSDYISKPIDKSKLIELIKKHLI
jgi:signal transduction histidine kinase